MKAIKTYATTADAAVAKVALSAAGIDSVVVGVDVAMEGGIGGVALLVGDESVDAAHDVLDVDEGR